MGATEKSAGGGFACIVEGCMRPAKTKTKPGKCNACTSKDSYHRKNPDAPFRGVGHWGKYRDVACSVDGCAERARIGGKCQLHYGRQYWADGKGRRSAEDNRKAHLKHRYGITLDEYNRMLAAQDGCCAVCRQPPSASNTRAHWNGKLCVDHCHGSGRVRALLCNDCNLAVGYAKTARTAFAVAEYLRLHGDTD